MSLIPQTQPDRLAWLLIVEADTTYRFASEEISLSDQSGQVLSCDSSLSADEMTESVSGSGSAGTFAFPIPDYIEDIDAFLMSLTSGTAEVSLIPVDQNRSANLSDRIVFRYGRIDEVTEATGGKNLVSITIVGNESDDLGNLCPTSNTIDDRSFPTSPDDSKGKVVPFVYGQPGSYEYETNTNVSGVLTVVFGDVAWPSAFTSVPTRSTVTTGATPAYAVDREMVTLDPVGDGSVVFDVPWYPQNLVISAHPVDATSVELWAKMDQGTTTWITSDVTPFVGYDRRGTPVSMIDLSTCTIAGATGLPADQATLFQKASEWWVSWRYGGALTGQTGTAEGNLGSLVRDVLRRSTLPIDWSSVNAACTYLSRYKIGGFVDDTISPADWVRDRIRPFGVQVRWTQAGFGLAVVDPQVGPGPVARIVLGEDAEYDGNISYRDHALDEIVVSWASAQSSQLAQRRVSSRIRRVGAPSIIGGDRTDELSLPEVWDSSTAIAAGDLAIRLEGGYTEAKIQAPTAKTWWIRAGDHVQLVDDSRGWTESDDWIVMETRHTTDIYRPLVLRRYSPISTKASATLEDFSE